MRRLYSIITLLCLIPISCWSSEVDSLLSRLQSSKDKKDKIETLHELSWHLAGVDNEASLSYAEQSLNLSLTADNKELIATSYNRIGLAYDYSSDFDLALENYEVCRRIREDLGDKEGISASYNNIGGVYYYKGDYDKALEYYLKSLEERKELEGDPNQRDMLIAQSMNNIALVHKASGNYNEAIEWYGNSIKKKREIDDQLGVCTSLANIGALYLALDERDSARSNLDEALQLANDLENSYNIKMCQNNLGLLDLKEGKYSEAIQRYEDIIKREIESKNVLEEGTARVNLSSALQEMEDFGRSIKEAEHALDLGKSTGSIVLQQNALLLLNNGYKSKGDHKSALSYYEEYVVLQDSIFNMESDQRYNDLLVSYKTREKEDSIESLNLSNDLLEAESQLKEEEIEKRTWIGYLLGLGIVCAVLAIFFIIRSARIRKNALIRENELQVQSIVREMDGLRARLEADLEDQPKMNLGIDQTMLNDYLMNPLSDRELDVLKEVAEGKTNKEIAEVLFVSVNTVKTHILNIYVKLDVQNRTQAAVKAGSLQILENSSKVP